MNRAPSELEEIKTDIEDITPEDELDDDAKKKDVFQSKAAKYLIKGIFKSIFRKIEKYLIHTFVCDLF